MAAALTAAYQTLPGYQNVRNRLLGQLGPEPTVAGATGPPSAPLQAAPLAATTAPAAPQSAAAPALQAALSTRLNPQVGERRSFPNGKIGQWDGTGWLHVGG